MLTLQKALCHKVLCQITATCELYQLYRANSEKRLRATSCFTQEPCFADLCIQREGSVWKTDINGRFGQNYEP